MSKEQIVTVGVIVYFILLLGFGVYGWLANRKDFGDYVLASKSLPALALILTVAATQHSMFVTVGAVGTFYSAGLVFLWGAAGWTLLQPLFYRHFGYRIWRLGNRFGHETPLDLFRERYGYRPFNILLVVILLLFTAPYIAASTIGAGLVFVTVSGGAISYEVGSALLLGVMLIMVFMGGMRAVAWADVFQGILTFVMMWVAAIYVLGVELPGPSLDLFREIAERAPERLVIDDGAYLKFTSLILVFGVGVMFQPQLWQRMLIGKSPRSNSHVSGLIAFYLTLIFIPGFLMGLAAIVLLPGIEDTDRVLPELIFSHTPLAIALPLICGVLAAGMSTVQGILLTISSMIAKDVSSLVTFRKQPDSRALFRIARFVVLGLAMLAYGLALMRPDTIVRLTALGWSGPIQLLPAFIGAVYWARGTKHGAFWGTLSGVVLLVVLDKWNPTGIPPIFISLAVNFLVFFVASLLTEPSSYERLERVFCQGLGRSAENLPRGSQGAQHAPSISGR